MFRRRQIFSFGSMRSYSRISTERQGCSSYFRQPSAPRLHYQAVYFREGTEVLLKLDGFSIQDQLGTARTVNHQGCNDLSGLLKVTAGYEKSVSIFVLNLQFQTEKRVLIMHTPSEAACGMGTTLGSLKFNRDF